MQPDFIRLTTVRGQARLEGSRTKFFGVENGVFARWHFDGETLLIENDAHGFYPLFYFEREGEICASPSLVKLLEIGAPPEFDEAALAVFLRLGFFVGEDTAFRAIRALPPGARLVWRDGATRLTGAGYVQPRETDLPVSEVVREFAELFQKSVAAMLPANDNFAVPLSGGRDSRFILFELNRRGCQPLECLTLQHFPPRADEDEQIAAKICETLKLPHLVLPQPDSPLAAELQKNLLTHFASNEHAWYLPLAKRIENRFERIYDGLAGDVLTGGIVFEPRAVENFRRAIAQNNYEKAAESILNEGYLPNLLRKKALARFSRATARTRLAAELAKHRAAANPIVSFLFYNRTRRQIALAPFGILNRRTQVYTPFLDQDLVALLLSVPFETSDETKLRDQAINFAFPELANIAFEKKHYAPAPNLRFAQKFSVDLLRFADVRKSSGLIRKSFWTSRIARCLIDRKYTASIHDFGSQIVYLLQLERLVGAPRG